MDRNGELQWSAAARNRCVSAARELSLALATHLETLQRLTGDDEDYPALFSANEALSAALRTYNNTTIDFTGTTAVPAESLLGADDEDDTSTDQLPGSTGREFTVEARFDLLVQDVNRLREYVRQRISEAGLVVSVQDDATGIPDWLSLLFRLDGWDSARYVAHGLQPAGEGWRVSLAAKTLHAMDRRERQDVGF